MDISSVFRRYRAHVRTLCAHIPALHEALGGREPLDSLPGWRELVSRPAEIIEVDGNPLLVATLFGPSGAGKSTVFRLLTGIDVPAGEVPRPRSYSCGVAVPARAAGQVKLEQVFPGWHCIPLSSPDQLGDPAAPDDTLYYAPFQARREAEGAWLLLADVPDFNTVEKRNWAKAERMAARAEIVVFMSHPEGYIEAVVVDHLLRCCRHAGHLAYVMTKTNAGDARARWDDLLRRAHGGLPGFDEMRSDGRTLAQFLAGADAYCSPRSEAPRLEDIQPLRQDAPPFPSLLLGADGTRILLANLVEVTRTGVASCAYVCTRAAAARDRLSERTGRIGALLDQCALVIAGAEFPAGRMLELIIETARHSRPAWLRCIAAPVSFIARGVVVAVKHARTALRKLKGGELRDELRPREDLERQRLGQAVEALATALRAEFEDEIAAGMLVQSRCRSFAEQFIAMPVPPIHDDWETFVRTKIAGWAHAHPWRNSVLGSLTDVLALIGGGAIVLDLFVGMGGGALAFSGVAGKLGIVGAAGAGCFVASVLLKLFEELGLRDTLLEIDEAWRRQRALDMRGHLEAGFARPLILGEYERMAAALAAAPLDECRAACASLESYMELIR
ncbi:hypothetical protein GX586_12340 [bacterium]|nr:hypothetical protein [bacterium]